ILLSRIAETAAEELRPSGRYRRLRIAPTPGGIRLVRTPGRNTAGARRRARSRGVLGRHGLPRCVRLRREFSQAPGRYRPVRRNGGGNVAPDGRIPLRDIGGIARYRALAPRAQG